MMKNESIKVAGIVVAYNIDKNEILNNIYTYINFVNEVIIVDNSDNIGNLKELEKLEKIKYINLRGNEGIAKALNKGIEYAIQNEYDFILTMDQDSKFDNNLIDIYINYLDDKTAIYSPNYIIERKKEKKYKKDIQNVYWTMTSGNLLNLNLYKIIGKFREDFFIDGVDYEYCLRARKNGYNVLQCNKARLIHCPGITKTKKILFKKYKYGYMSPIRMYYQIRNLSVIAKEYKSIKAHGILIIKFLKIIILFDKKKKFLKMYYKGIKDSKCNNYGKYMGENYEEN